MTPWLERLRRKNRHTVETVVTKVPEVEGLDVSKKFVDGREGGDKSAESSTFVTSGTPNSTVPEVFSTAVHASPAEVMIVAYQRFSLDYDLPDGTYMPEELSRAKLLVKPGSVLRYRLRWPGGSPQPIGVGDAHASRLRSQPNAVGAPVVAIQQRT